MSKIKIESNELNIDKIINLLQTFATVNNCAIVFTVVDRSKEGSGVRNIKSGYANYPIHDRQAILITENQMEEILDLLKKNYNDSFTPL
jgi:hypothetical protein